MEDRDYTLIDLFHFLASGQRNAWVRHEGMELYVRRSAHMVRWNAEQEWKSAKTFDLANILTEESERGQGKLWALIKWLQENLPSVSYDGIYVENVLNDRLAASLRARGHYEISRGYTGLGQEPCFFIPLLGSSFSLTN